jgi:hypothetical protein
VASEAEGECGMTPPVPFNKKPFGQHMKVGKVIGFSWWLDTEWFYQLAKVRAPEMPPPQGSDKTREIQ